MVEAIVFASSEPVSEKALLERLPDDVELDETLSAMKLRRSMEA